MLEIHPLVKKSLLSLPRLRKIEDGKNVSYGYCLDKKWNDDPNLYFPESKEGYSNNPEEWSDDLLSNLPPRGDKYGNVILEPCYLYLGDDHVPLLKDVYTRKLRKRFERESSKGPNDCILVSALITFWRYPTANSQLCTDDFPSFALGLERFPLRASLEAKCSLPEGYDWNEFNHVWLNDFCAIGSKPYDFLLQCLANQFSDYHEAYYREFAAVKRFFTAIGLEPLFSVSFFSFDSLYKSDRLLVKTLWDLTKRGEIEWAKRTAPDGREYREGKMPAVGGARATVAIYPVNFAMDFYPTADPWLYQIKSEGLSKFFALGDDLGRIISKLARNVDERTTR